MNNEVLRRIPSIEQLVMVITKKYCEGEEQKIAQEVLVQLLRRATQKVRQRLQSDLLGTENIREADLQNEVLAQFYVEEKKILEPNLKKIINATGIVLHTNLGRSPISARAQKMVKNVMEGYSTLEYDLKEGRRGERYSHVEQRLIDLTGAEAALAVNNNAAAVLLTLTGIARGKEVIISRGELVEIGGSFRIPDVIRQSGAILVEVGTTNKTHLDDFVSAITNNTAAILKVHTSNYEIVGFASQPEVEAVCRLAREKNLVSINDVGSGSLETIVKGSHVEPSVRDCFRAGFDVVTFSGDKLLGAGQAGIIVGKKKYVDLLKRESLLRALRIDKLSLAALEGTLIDYATGMSGQLIPVWAMMNLEESALVKKAEALVAKLTQLTKRGWGVKVIKTSSLAGGGSLPTVEFNGIGVELAPVGVTVSVAVKKLRSLAVPVICLVRENALVFDVRCVFNDDIDYLVAELVQLAGVETR